MEENPGKVIDPYEPTENLPSPRGTYAAMVARKTHFNFSDELKEAWPPCCDVSASAPAGAMDVRHHVPRSSMATRDEEAFDAPARAPIWLYEMFEGQGKLPAPFRGANEAVKEGAFDLCLSCKDCKSDCPRQRRHGDVQGEFCRITT